MVKRFTPDKGRFFKMSLILFLAALVVSQLLNVLWDLLVKGAM